MPVRPFNRASVCMIVLVRISTVGRSWRGLFGFEQPVSLRPHNRRSLVILIPDVRAGPNDDNLHHIRRHSSWELFRIGTPSPQWCGMGTCVVRARPGDAESKMAVGRSNRKTPIVLSVNLDGYWSFERWQIRGDERPRPRCVPSHASPNSHSWGMLFGLVVQTESSRSARL